MDLREIDIEVHRKVFGELICLTEKDFEDGSVWYADDERLDVGSLVYVDTDGYHQVPHYSSDWNDFGNLLVAVCDKWDCSPSIGKLPSAFTGKKWRATVSGGRLGYDNADCMIVIRDTDPLVAFCKAVLELKPLTDEEIAAIESESGD